MSTDASIVPADGLWSPVTPRGEQAFAAIAAQPGRTLLASDFDGTLAPIVPDPRDSRPHPAAKAAFARLGERLGQVAVVTGREVAVARQLGSFDEPGFARLVVLGQYGQEQWDASTGEMLVPPVPGAVREALAELQDLLAGGAPLDLSGVVLEDKGRGIGVHTRRAADPAAALAWLREPVGRIAARHGLGLEPGRNVLELRSSRVTKGDGIGSLVERVHPSVVVMMGDDLGDVAAFERLRELEQQGITAVCVVAASAEQPGVAAHADVLCGGPAGIAAWLEGLLEALDQAGRGSR